MNHFKINFLDHVAIRVKDLEVSAAWYADVLGMKRYQFEEWGTFPIFMMAGKTGVALFPADSEDSLPDPNTKNIKIDHFAFNVDGEDFDLAKQHLEQLKIPFQQKNHTFFESIYMNDPDGHCVELTTILVPKNEFYKA
ncbi:MAG: VOC family protein [Saprospiraceae bacterium]|nr:VOC family protein [Saprospiraceae bacterium]